MTPSTFARHAEAYSLSETTVCPLRKNEDGMAKVPMGENYIHLKPEGHNSHDWAAADGLGIVLGHPSGGLAVIDVDDTGLSECLLGYLRDATVAPPTNGSHAAWTPARLLH